MKSFKRVGLVVAVGAAVCLPAGTAGAAAKDCGRAGKLTDITANGTTCSKAKAVARRWKRGCNYAGRCQVEGRGTGGQWVCRGRKSSSRLREKCTGGPPKATVKFSAPA
jgi:hypothetical protein